MKPAALNPAATWPIDAAGALLCAALVAGAYFIHVRPESDAKAALDGQREALAALLDESARERDLTASAERRHRAAENLVASSPVQLLPVSRLNERISDLARCAEESGLRVDQITSGLPTTESRARIVSIRFVGSGGYEQAWTFLREIKTSFVDTSVSAFRLSGNPGAHDQPGSISVDLRWFAAPDGTDSTPEPPKPAGAP